MAKKIMGTAAVAVSPPLQGPLQALSDGHPSIAAEPKPLELSAPHPIVPLNANQGLPALNVFVTAIYLLDIPRGAVAPVGR